MTNLRFKFNLIDKILIFIIGAGFVACAIAFVPIVYHIITGEFASLVYSPRPLLSLIFIIIGFFLLFTTGYRLLKINLCIKNNCCNCISINKEMRYFTVTANKTNIKIPFDNIQSLEIQIGLVLKGLYLGHVRLITTDGIRYELTISKPKMFCKKLNSEPFFFQTEEYWYKASWHNQ